VLTFRSFETPDLSSKPPVLGPVPDCDANAGHIVSPQLLVIFKGIDEFARFTTSAEADNTSDSKRNELRIIVVAWPPRDRCDVVDNLIAARVSARRVVIMVDNL
jgi:hypothetical protein